MLILSALSIATTIFCSLMKSTLIIKRLRTHNLRLEFKFLFSYFIFHQLHLNYKRQFWYFAIREDIEHWLWTMLGRNWTRQNCTDSDSRISAVQLFTNTLSLVNSSILSSSCGRICREAPLLLSSAFIDHWFVLNGDATNSFSAIFFSYFSTIYTVIRVSRRTGYLVFVSGSNRDKTSPGFMFPMFSLFFPRSLDACCSLVANPFYHSPSKLPHVAESMTSFIFKYDIEVTYAVQLRENCNAWISWKLFDTSESSFRLFTLMQKSKNSYMRVLKCVFFFTV